MKSGWEINEFKYAYGKSILQLLKARSLITNNEYEKCREGLVKQYAPIIGSLDGELLGEEKSNLDRKNTD